MLAGGWNPPLREGAPHPGWRVGLVCCEYPPAAHGGIGSFSRDLARGLCQRGHTVFVIGAYDPSQLADLGPAHDDDEGVRVVRLPMRGAARPTPLGFLLHRVRLTHYLRRRQRDWRLDLLEAPDWTGWLPFRAPRGPLRVTRLHGAQVFYEVEAGRRQSRLAGWAERGSICHADAVIAVSNYVGRRTMEICRTPATAYEVIHNGVDTRFFCPEPGTRVEPGRIVYVNSLRPKKGIEQLVAAMNTVCARFPEAHLVAVGKDFPGRNGAGCYSAELSERLEPEVRKQVRFLGHRNREEVLAVLRRAEVCCFPSHAEAFGLGPVEAMAVAKPTIFMRGGPGPEIIEDGVSGLLCQPTEPADIADKLCRVLGDPELARRLGVQARARAVRCFDGAAWLERNIQFYEACLNRRRPGAEAAAQ